MSPLSPRCNPPSSTQSSLAFLSPAREIPDEEPASSGFSALVSSPCFLRRHCALHRDPGALLGVFTFSLSHDGAGGDGTGFHPTEPPHPAAPCLLDCAASGTERHSSSGGPATGRSRRLQGPRGEPVTAAVGARRGPRRPELGGDLLGRRGGSMAAGASRLRGGARLARDGARRLGARQGPRRSEHGIKEDESRRRACHAAPPTTTAAAAPAEHVEAAAEDAVVGDEEHRVARQAGAAGEEAPGRRGWAGRVLAPAGAEGTAALLGGFGGEERRETEEQGCASREREGRPLLLVVVRWRQGGERLLPPSAMGERESRGREALALRGSQGRGGFASREVRRGAAGAAGPRRGGARRGAAGATRRHGGAGVLSPSNARKGREGMVNGDFG